MTSEATYRTGGPVPKFKEYHLWKTIVSLDDKVPLGRKRLSSLLGIGEGSTRTILNLLSKQNFVNIEKSGVCLTKEGKEFKDSIYIDVHAMTASELTIGEENCAVRIPHASKKISFGCEERDIAIKSGATGATTLVCSNGKLLFPGSDYPVEESVDKELRSLFKIKNDDVIIIGTAHEPDAAECGAVTAALSIIGGLNLKSANDVLSSIGMQNVLLSLAFTVHDLVGGLPVCAKTRDDLGIRIENGSVIDNAYTGKILEQVINTGETVRTVADEGPYKDTKVIVAPIEIDNIIIAAIGVVDIKGIADENTLLLFTTLNN